MIATSRLRLALGPGCLFGFLVSLTAAATGGCAKVSMTTPVGGGSGGTIGSMVTIPGLTSLTVSVSPAMITLNQSNGQIVPGTASVAAVANLQDGTTLDATDKVTWILTPSLGMIQGGVLTVSTPGIFTIMATNGPISSNAVQLTATFSGNFNDPLFDPANAGRLEGTTTGTVNIAYPLDGAVFPSNLGAITVHVSKPGAQDIARLAWLGDGLDVRYYAPCLPAIPTVVGQPPAGGACYVDVPSEITRLFLAASTSTNVKLTVRLASLAGGSLVESNTIGLAWANVPLSGGLYYWTTIQPGVVPGYHLPAQALVGTGIQRYNLDPAKGVAAPEAVPVYTDQGTAPGYYGSPPALEDGAQCVGCHAITNDGKTMALSVGGSLDSDFALLDIATKTLTSFNLAAAGGSTSVMDINYYKQFRREAFATATTFGPKGDVMVNMFRSQLTLHAVNASLMSQGPVAPSFAELKTDPFWSFTGKFFVFASYPSALPVSNYNPTGLNGDLKNGAQIVIADANDTSVLDNAKVLVPRKAGFTSFYPVVSTDDALVAFDQSTCGNGVDVNKMGTDYGSGTCDGYDDSSAVLWLTSPGGRTPVRLDHANGGATNDNSWPRFSPNIGSFRGQKLYWLAFSSRRPYGLQVNNGVLPVQTRPQLWFAAVVTGAEFSGDPSFSPVWLPKQNPDQSLPSGNHVPQWVKVAVAIQ